jgi:hypothetical protein
VSILLDVLAVGAVDSLGEPLVSGQAHVYKVGTTTLATIYEDRECTIPVANPVQLNAAGKAEVYALEEVRVLLEDADGVLVDDIDSTGSVYTDTLTDLQADITALEAEIDLQSVAPIGAVSNLGLVLSGGELKITAQDGTTLSGVNYGRVYAPGATAGTTTLIEVTTSPVLRDDANAASDLHDLGFGITETAHWAEDVPFFLYVANRLDSVLSGADGNSAFFISKSPCMSTTPASADDIGNTTTIPVNDSQNVILLLGDYYTVANYVSLPCQIVGAFRMRWSTTTDDWTIQALGNKDGFGEAQINKTLATQWTFPTGQLGAQSGKHFATTDGSTTLTFDPINGVTYFLHKNGDCTVDFNFATQNAAGADATAVRFYVPYTSVGSNYRHGAGFSSLNNTPTSCVFILGTSSFATVSGTTTGAINDNEFAHTNDYIRGTLTYKAFA